MAFKILNDDAIALLSDNQRKQYENELRIYQQRVAFVERLEVLENADIKPYEPKIEKIQVINDFKHRSFEKPEYLILACKTKVKPKVEVKTIDKLELKRPVLPVTIRPEVKVKEIQKIEGIQPALPSITKPTVAKICIKKTETRSPDLPKVLKANIELKSYKMPKYIKADLPSVTKPFIKPVTHIEELTKHQLSRPTPLPNVIVPSIVLTSFAAPEKTKVDLPEVPAACAKIPVFRKPENPNITLPNVDMPSIDVDFKGVKPIQPDLPRLPEINAPVKALVSIQIAPNLPKTAKPVVKPKDFISPVQSAPDLPTLPKLNIDIKSFKRPQYKGPNVKAQMFGQFKKVSPVTAPVPSINFKTLEKLEKSIELPKKSTMVVPDAQSALEEIRTAIKDTIALEG